jgi:hypothetical protein
VENLGEDSNSWSSQRKGEKVEAFGFWSPSKSGKKCASSGGSTVASDRWEEEIWLIGFYVQEGEGGAHRKKDGSAPSDRIKIPINRWIGRELCMV